MKAFVTIFVPVHNGGVFFKKCIESILRQRFSKFELIVLENKSNDGNLEWLSKIHDSRLRIIPAKKKLSISSNFARALKVKKAKYMTFVGSDDFLYRNYLSEMVKLIAKYPDASTYFAHFRYIDKSGKKLRSCRRLSPKETCHEYLCKLFSHKRDTYGTGYVYKSKDYEEIGGFPKWKGLLFADDALWISLMEKSYNANSSKECFAVRINDEGFGHVANWKNWVENMHLYAKFLEKKAKENRRLGCAYKKFGPKYFLDWCNMFYDRILEKANTGNFRLPSNDVKKLTDVLKKTSPNLLKDFNGISYKTIRKRFINKYHITRLIYKKYRIFRYG